MLTHRRRALNHLAHAWLAGPDPDLLVGGLLGDHWRGDPDPAWPAGVRRGVLLHRRIDAATDGHPAVVEARRRFAPPLRRFAGILLDLWFDHLLARDFAALTGEPLRAFADRANLLLAAPPPGLPAPFLAFAARLAEHDVLARYADRATLGPVLVRVGARLKRANPIGEALPALEALAPELDVAFARLWPDLEAFAAAERARLSP